VHHRRRDRARLAYVRAYVDRGYRGHDADRARVILSGQKRGITPTIRRERSRRGAIEPVIDHMRPTATSAATFCAAPEDDAARHNLRLLRAWLAWLLAFLLSLPTAISSDRRRSSAAAPGRLKDT